MGASQLVVLQSEPLFPAKVCTDFAVAFLENGSTGARFGSQGIGRFPLAQDRDSIYYICMYSSNALEHIHRLQ